MNSPTRTRRLPRAPPNDMSILARASRPHGFGSRTLTCPSCVVQYPPLESPQHLFFVLLLAARGKNRCCGDFCGNQSCFSLLGRDNCNGRHAARVSESSIETVICSFCSSAPIQHTCCYFQFVNRRSGVRIPQPANPAKKFHNARRYVPSIGQDSNPRQKDRAASTTSPPGEVERWRLRRRPRRGEARSAE